MARKAQTTKKAGKRTAKTPRKRIGGKRSSLLSRILFFPFRLMRSVLLLMWRVTWRIAAVSAMVVGLAVFYVWAQLPEDPAELIDGRARGSVVLLDRHGEPFAWRGQHFAGVTTVENASRHLTNAVIATEDKRFRWHPGIDPRGTARALWRNYRASGNPLRGEGGSTLTQQTAKLLCFGQAYDPNEWESERDYERSCRRTKLVRKMQEAVFAMALEARYSKDEILMIYFNRAYLGAGSQGFAAASARYFDVTPAELKPSQAAMLAGLLTAPSSLAPTASLARAQGRAGVVIGLMEDQGYLSAEEAASARANPATLSSRARQSRGGYFANWVMDEAPEFFTRNTKEDVIIRTTFDPALQAAAEAGLLKVFEERVSASSRAEAAVVVMDEDGAVRAIVGGRDVDAQDAFDRATQASRQSGSAFKPFVYAAAMDLGYLPNATIVDEPITINIPGSGPWRPQNYNRRFAGRVTLTTALARSLNIPAVKISEAVGRDNIRKIASDFGIESDLAAGPALALGVSEATLLEMTGAYAGILNGGSSVTPYGILDLRLRGENEPLMGHTSGLGERVITERAAEYLIYMMSKVVTEGTGQRAQLADRESAGKTGTSQAARDAWYIGFTADYVAGVWMGYDDNTPLNDVTGGGLPANIWADVMAGVHQGLPARALPMRAPPAPEPARVREEPREPASRSEQPPTSRVEQLPQQQERGGIGRALRNIFGRDG